MAYFLLTNLLLDALRNAAVTGGKHGNCGTGRRGAGTSRIVNIASRYGNTKLDFDDLQTAKGKYSYLRSTPPTMLARVLLTQEFAERLHGSGVVANAVHPGLVKNTALLQDVAARSAGSRTRSAPRPKRRPTHRSGSPRPAKQRGLRKALDEAQGTADARNGLGPGSPQAALGRVLAPGRTAKVSGAGLCVSPG